MLFLLFPLFAKSKLAISAASAICIDKRRKSILMINDDICFLFYLLFLFLSVLSLADKRHSRAANLKAVYDEDVGKCLVLLDF
jgi:hypothetical protein